MDKVFTELSTAINNFPQQFAWRPELQNAEILPNHPEKIAVCGMGGSALAANVLIANPKVPDVRIHRDYWHTWLQDMDLIVVSSYSGNTEEMIDVYNHAKMASVPVAVATNGGQLLDMAAADGIPYIQLADAPQPRYAIGYSYIALSQLVSAPLSSRTGEALSELTVDSGNYDQIAADIAGKQIVFYTTPQNFSIGYVWKILTNESAKQLAWINKFPEFNHNELNGYFTSDKFDLTENLAVVILESNNEHPRNLKRIEIIAKQIADRGITVHRVAIPGNNLLERVVQGWQAGMYFTLELAHQNNVNPKEVTIIEDLKTQLSA